MAFAIYDRRLVEKQRGGIDSTMCAKAAGGGPVQQSGLRRPVSMSYRNPPTWRG
jgi:hypothetical protein